MYTNTTLGTNMSLSLSILAREETLSELSEATASPGPGGSHPHSLAPWGECPQGVRRGFEASFSAKLS